MEVADALTVEKEGGEASRRPGLGEDATNAGVPTGINVARWLIAMA